MRSPHVQPGSIFRSALEAMPDAVVVVDDEGVIVVANAQVATVFGHDPMDLEGQVVELLVPPGSRGGHPTIRAAYTQRPMGLLPLAAVRKDGTEFPAEISLAPILDASTTLTVATIRDISERVRLEREAERMRDELLATVTHELRTPLTSIIGNAELMADLPESEVGPLARRLLDVIERNAQRELRLVTDVLAMAVDSVDRPSLDLVALDAVALVEETVKLRRLQARERGISLTAVPSDEPCLVSADGHRLMQVFDNLINNALKFTRPGGHVTLSVSRRDGAVTIAFADTGVGMSPGEEERVFNRLYRASNAVRSETPGAGLGLSISRSIVEMHGGTISLESELDVGTVVTIVLPSVAADDASVGPSSV